MPNTKILVATGGDIKIREYLKDALLEIIEIGNKNNVQWVCTGTRKDGILVEENTETSLTLTRGNYYLISEVQIERQHFFFRR